MEIEVNGKILHFNNPTECQSIFEEARRQVSDEHPIKCVCGRLCAGLHEMRCSKFNKAVERRVWHIFKTSKNKKPKDHCPCDALKMDDNACDGCSRFK